MQAMTRDLYAGKTGWRKFSALLLLLMIVATSLSVFSQPAPAGDTLQKKKEIPLIPATRFAGELPPAVSKLQDIKKKIISPQEIRSLQQNQDSLLAEINKIISELSSRDTGHLAQRVLMNYSYLFQQEKEKLDRWQEIVETRLEELQEHKSETNYILNRWKHSLEANGSELTPDNRKILDSFMASAKNLSDTIQLRSLDLMRMLQSISNHQILLNNKLSDLEAEQEKQQNMLLNTRGPALFDVITGKAPGYVFLGNLRENFRNNLPPLRAYLNNNYIRLVWVLLIFIFLYLSLILLNRNKQQEEISGKKEDSYIGKAFILVSHPLWTALFLSLLTARFILISAPHELYILLYTFTLVPLFMLIPAMLNKENKYYFYIIGLLFFFDNISELFFYGTVFNNLMLILLSLILILTLIRHNRESMSLIIFPGRFFKGLVTGFNYLTIITLSVTIVVTFFGYYKFQEFVVTAYVWIYFAIYLFNTANVTIAGLFELYIYSSRTDRYKSVSKYREQITRNIIHLLNLVTFFLWLYVIIALFGFREEVAAAFIAVWNFGFTTGNMDITIGNISVFLFTIWLSLQIARIIQAMLEEDVLDKFKLERGVPQSISILVKYTIVILGFFIAAGAAGMEMSNLAFIFGALGVGIGFGLQDIINNFISGLILLFERPIHIGDNISIGTLEGVVRHIGIRSSIIQSYDRSEVVVPNSKLVSNEVINWTLSNQMRRLEIRVGVAYGSDIEKVMHLLETCATEHKEVLENPPPYVWFKEFDNSSINFRLLFFYPRFDGGQTVRSEVAAAIVKTFRDHNITIPFPQMDVYVREAMKEEEGGD